MRAAVVLAVLVAVASARLAIFDGFRGNQHHARSIEDSQSTACNTYSCVQQGGNCSLLAPYTNIPLCFDGYCQTSGTCPTVPSLGQSCTTSCTAGNICHPTSGTCVASVSVNPPGGSCTQNVNCIFNNVTSVFGECNNGVCYGLALGASCTSFSQCSGRAYCASNGVCTALLANGASCGTGDTCTESDTCNSGTCVRIGSVASGGTCSNDDACGDGYYCSSSGTCSQPPTGGQSCSVTSDCPSGATCGCPYTPSAGQNTSCIPVSGNSNGITAIETAIGDCVASNNCIDIQCAQKNCASQYCKYRAFVVAQAPQFSGFCYSNYIYQATLGNIPNIGACSSSSGNAGNALVASASLVAIAAFAAVL